MESTDKNIIFRQRTDFFWKSIAVYSVVLVMYSLLRGSIENQTLTLKLEDPLVVLFAIFILFAMLSIIYRVYIGRSITIKEHSITFTNRLGTKTFDFSQIRDLKVSKKRIYNTRSEIRVVKIGFDGRTRYIRIRPASYENPILLTKELINIKKSIKY